MDEDEFKLFSTDETIRQLMDDPTKGPSVRWQMQVLHKIDKLSDGQKRLGNVTVLEFKKLRQEFRHVQPAKLQTTIDERINEKLNSRTEKTFKAAIVYALKHWIAPLALAYLGVKLGLKT